MIAAVALNAVVQRNAAVSVSHAVTHVATHAATHAVTSVVINAAVVMVLVMVMDLVTDLDVADAGGSGLFLSYSSSAADGASAEVLVDQDSSSKS